MEFVEKLAMNPYVNMTPKQIARLRELQRGNRPVVHYTTPPKQHTVIPKNQPKMDKQDDTEQVS